MKPIKSRILTLVCLLSITLYGLQPAVAVAESSTTTPTTPTTSTSTNNSTNPSSSSTNSSTPSTSTISSNSSSKTSSSTVTGPNKPTGPAANTYTYDPTTGMWENEYYIWDPSTGQTMPRYPQTYSYNPATGMWDTTQWVYNAATGKYQANIISTSVNPNPSTGSSTTTIPSITNSPTTAVTRSGSNSSTNSSSNTSGTSNNGTFNLFYNPTISNNFQSAASSGDASILDNTNGGSATTGSAQDILNMLNILNSTMGLNITNPMLFEANIIGNVTGDMTIDPTQASTQTASADPINLQVNTSDNSSINNNISLDATSGNATVATNTNAGNATTGNADAMADVMNILNSSVDAGQSFIGEVNIYGNLNGDILLPSSLLNDLSLIGSNDQSTISLDSPGSQTTNNTSNQTINNQVSTTANSGNATVNDNTTAGSATTGNSSTDLNVLNLTGNSVVGQNELLVFVNVLGSWVGMIVDSPSGATASALGSGITQDSNVSNSSVNSTSNQTINNNILVNATSGNATVYKNTNAGSATSGNASAGANILNLTNSNISLSGWLGILFINVFGNWYGSFGENTSAGNPVATPALNNPSNFHQVFAFLSKDPLASNSNSSSNSSQNDPTSVIPLSTLASETSSSSTNLNGYTQVLGINTTKPNSNSSSNSSNGNVGWLAIFGILISLALIAIEQDRTKHERQITQR